MSDLVIMVAMPEEEQMLIQALQQNYFFSTAPVISRVRVIMSGIGKVNSAIVLSDILQNEQRLFGKMPYVCNIGYAGAIKSGFKLGEVVVPLSAFYHDVNVSHSIRDIYAQHFFVETGLRRKGVIGTGDSFVQATHVFPYSEIPDMIDMECRALSQVCHANDVAFLPIKIISDLPFSENHTFNPLDTAFHKSFTEAVNVLQSAIELHQFPRIQESPRDAAVKL